MGVNKVRSDLNYTTYLVQNLQKVNATNTNRPSLALKDEINFIDGLIKTYEGTTFLDENDSWNSVITYNKGYVVSYLGNKFISLIDSNTNITPVDGASWKLAKTLDNRFVRNYGTQSIIEVRPNGTNTRFKIQDTDTTVNGDFYIKTDDGVTTRVTFNNAGDTTINLGNFIVSSGNIGISTTGTLNLGYSTTTGIINIGNAVTSGSINIGQAGTTGVVSLNPSTGASTTTVAGGANGSGVTKTVNVGTGGSAGSTTNINIGSASSTTTITANGNINGTNITLSGDIAVNGADITSTTTGTFNLVNTNATTVNIAGAGTAVNIGAATGTTAIKNNATVAGTLGVTGAVTLTSDLTVNGNITVNGTTTTINAATISVDDKNIELNSIAAPTDALADGGGITLHGSTDKLLTWIDLNDAWTSNQNFDLTTGFEYRINNASVLSATTLGSGVLNSSLTSVGTITTGVWNATAIADAKIASALTGKTYNGLTLTANAAGFSVAGGTTSKTLTINRTLTFDGTDGTTFTFPSTTGTVAITSNKLNVFAATTSAELAGVISDETGSGALVFATSPSLTTPTIGVATATSINKVAITAPATSATLTLANGSTLVTAGAFSTTFTSTATTSLTLPTSGTLATLAGTETLTNKTLTSPVVTTSMTTGSTSFDLLNTTATTVNFAGAGTTVNIGASTGTTSIKNNLYYNGVLSSNNDARYDGSIVTSATSEASLTSFAATTYRSFEILIQATRGTDYHSSKLIGIHNGTNANVSEYGMIATNTDLFANVRADIVSGNVNIYVTPTSATSTTFKFSINLIKA